jgi:hypothetical protein
MCSLQPTNLLPQQSPFLCWASWLSEMLQWLSSQQRSEEIKGGAMVPRPQPPGTFLFVPWVSKGGRRGASACGHWCFLGRNKAGPWGWAVCPKPHTLARQSFLEWQCRTNQLGLKHFGKLVLKLCESSHSSSWLPFWNMVCIKKMTSIKWGQKRPLWPLSSSC